MKLKESFITYDTGDDHIMVPTGAVSGGFHGMVRSNRTAGFVVECLKEDITRDALIDRMEAKYDAPRQILEEDVDRVLDALRKIGALAE